MSILWGAGLLPINWFRAIGLLLLISATLVVTDDLAKLMNAESPLVSGFVFGGLIYILAMNGGFVVRFCVKGELKDNKIGKGAESMINQWVPLKNVRVSVLEFDKMRTALVGERGGYRLFITTGALREMSPAGMIGVLAHEAGHVRLKHTDQLCVLFGALGGSKIAFGVPPIGVVLLLFAYLYLSRIREFAADEEGAKQVGKEAMYAAFSEHRHATGEADISRFSEFFVSHPSLHRRIQRIQNLKIAKA